MEKQHEDVNNDSILYELLEYFIRKQEPELVRYNNESAILSTTGTIKNALRYLNNSYSLPESISQQISLTLPWKFAVGDNGRLLAILYENIIEIRRSKDEFSSVIGKASVLKDAFSQWRKIAWSPDGSILVLASSNGHLSFYNSLGSNIFNINPKTESPNPDILEAGDAIASLLFKIPQKNTENWSYEILIVTYSGLLKSYLIESHAYELHYEFSFGNFYRKGVNAFAYDHQHNLYIVAGNSITQSTLSAASNTGLTSWRPLNDYPYFKLSFAFEESTTSHTLSLWNLIPKFRSLEEAVIFRISISPNCSHLVCLHTDGSISLWNLPNLQLKKKWTLTEQPNYNAHSPLIQSKNRKLPIGISEYQPLDIGWWSDHAIIIARYSGAVSVCSMNDLKNLLGTNPEFLYGQPQISEFYSDKGFLCLDCETVITTKKRIREPSVDRTGSEVSDSEKEEEELEPLTIMNYTTNLICRALYSMTDIERFQPKRKKSKILQRTYRIFGLKSTTPEELYSRKIDIEEYDDALALANSYNLDTDLVYQTRWRKSKFSLTAIQEHLSKVRKRAWILNECIMRVPDTLDAARELLNFGLKGTSLDTFLSIGDNDDGKIVISDNDDDSNQLNDVSVNLKYMQVANKKLKDVDLTALSLSQRDLLSYRKRLLDHLDKLKTYEIIIADSNKYKKDTYEEFRQLTILENAVRFARDCDHRAVGILFTYHGHKLMPHWLAIISCFPETLNPSEYKKLLPECDDQGQLFLLYQQELRPKDWSEKHDFETLININNDDNCYVIYEAEPSLEIYKSTTITMDLLTKWYKSRAYEIERNSCIVENSVELIKIGRTHRILELENFLLQLETLDDLIYKVYIGNMSLAQFEKLSDLEKIKLLMSTSSEQNFVTNLKLFVLPFIYRKQKYLNGDLDKGLLKSFLMNLSEVDLKLPLKFFESIKTDIELLNMIEDLIDLAINCIYSCTNPNMYNRAKVIFDTLPRPQPFEDASGKLIDPMGDLERELDCLKLLNKYHVLSTIKFIHDNKCNTEEIKLLLQQMSNSLNETTPPPSQDAWAEVLNDMCEVQEFIFHNITIEDCFEICVTSRLLSGLKINIQNCTSLIETKKKESSLLKVPYDKTVELILTASQNYFNNSKSFSDSNMELARTCLYLIEDENKRIREEYDLINSLQILDEFGISILPLQVRLCQDRLKLIENCLKNKKGAYKRQQRLLTLAAYLNIEGENARYREGKVLELIATKAFDVADYEACATTCQKLIDMNYFAAWKITQKLGFCDDYNDLMFKQKALTFTLTYGPTEMIEKTLQQMHLLEIQMLNKNLENCMMVYELELRGQNNGNDEDDDDDDDDAFTDAMTTPLKEVKEFVPKILETSTEIVKNSAQLVKQSTLGIIKNFIGNQSLWQIGNTENLRSDEHDEAKLIENRDKLLSFPYFYLSLHENCNVSRYDGQYDRYSMPDVENTKLKICQTLLRINALSETACYGLEVSDINHFLVLSAIEVFTDDWLLGLGYLLSIHTDYILHAELVFASLPQTDLYILTAMYFYSLKLYQKINNDHNDKWYTLAPMYLIGQMIAKVEHFNKNNDDSEINQIIEHLNAWHAKLLEKKYASDSENTKPVNNDEVPCQHQEEILDESMNREILGKEQLIVISEDINIDSRTEEVLYEKETEMVTEDVKSSWRERTDDDHVNNSVPKESKIQNLYDKDTFKMNVAEGTNADAEGWDDNWSDFSDNDDNVDNTIEVQFNDQIDVTNEVKIVKLPKKHILLPEKDEQIDADETEASGSEVRSSSTTDLLLKSDSPVTVDDSTEEKRYQIFNDLFILMETNDDYVKVKEALRVWPNFVDSQFTCEKHHPILRMIESAHQFVNKKSHIKNDVAVLQEYKELLKNQYIKREVFITFIKKFEDTCSFETKIFLRLCFDDQQLHSEAIELIKASKKTELSLPILEEIFFKNLTASFPPHHPIYNKILEEIFLNHTIDEIDANVRILIDKLIKLKHIPYAIALWNQLAAVPSALSTFESCYQLFLRK